MSKLVCATAFADALTGSCSNLHPRHPLHSANTIPKLKVDPLFLKFPFNLLYRLLLPGDDFKVSVSF